MDTYGTFLIPLAQVAFLKLVSLGTSGVPISFMANFQISARLRGTLLEAHSVGVLVNVNSVFSGHCHIDGRMALLAILLCGSHSAGPRLERWFTFEFRLLDR